METMVLRKIGFGAYIKIFFISGLGIGVLVGVIIFIIGLLGGPATATFGQTEYTGITAGLLALLIAPLSGALALCWFAVCMYPAFFLFLKLSNGIKIKAIIGPARVSAMPTESGISSGSMMSPGSEIAAD